MDSGSAFCPKCGNTVPSVQPELSNSVACPNAGLKPKKVLNSATTVGANSKRRLLQWNPSFSRLLKIYEHAHAHAQRAEQSSPKQQSSAPIAEQVPRPQMNPFLAGHLFVLSAKRGSGLASVSVHPAVKTLS